MSVKLSISIVAYHNYSDIEEAIATLEAYTPTTLTKKSILLIMALKKETTLNLFPF